MYPFPPHADSTLPKLVVLKARVALLAEAEVRKDWNRLSGSGKHYKLCISTINVDNLTDSITKKGFLSLSSQHNSLLKLHHGLAHVCLPHLDWPTLTLYLRLDKQQRQS